MLVGSHTSTYQAAPGKRIYVTGRQIKLLRFFIANEAASSTLQAVRSPVSANIVLQPASSALFKHMPCNLIKDFLFGCVF
jgi:hypothetical protein